MRFHLVVVAHNAAERSRLHFSGGSGSLIFNSDLAGISHYGNVKSCVPFQVGWLDMNRRFVHVLDDFSLEVVMRSRDTITDFVDYLAAKENLLHEIREQRARFFYAGEEELLAHYLTTMRNGRHDFDFPSSVNSVSIPEGDWDAFQSSPEREAQTRADQSSYIWDELIERFTNNITEDSYSGKFMPDINDAEKILRFLAREPRTRRRMLADALREIVHKTDSRTRGMSVFKPTGASDPHYCFLVLPTFPDKSYEEYLTARRILLEHACRVTKLVCPDALDIVGIATEPGNAAKSSEDALYFDARDWSEEAKADALRVQEQFKLLTNPKSFERKVSEYPLIPVLREQVKE